MEDDMEYFKIPIRSCWIIRFDKRPRQEVLDRAKRRFESNHVDLQIGISKSIVSNLLDIFNERKREIPWFGKQRDDLKDISSKMQLKLELIKIILEAKELIIEEKQ